MILSVLSRVQADCGGGVLDCDQALVQFINNTVFAIETFNSVRSPEPAVRLPARLFLALVCLRRLARAELTEARTSMDDLHSIAKAE